MRWRGQASNAAGKAARAARAAATVGLAIWQQGDRFIGTENARAGWMETRSELGEVNQSDYLNRQFVRQQTPARTGVVSAIKLENVQNEASVARNRGRPR